jgi:hypothetical protein
MATQGQTCGTKAGPQRTTANSARPHDPRSNPHGTGGLVRASASLACTVVVVDARFHARFH